MPPPGTPSHFVPQQFYPTVITKTNPITVTVMTPPMGVPPLTNGQQVICTKFITFPFALATGMEQLNYKAFYVNEVNGNSFILTDAGGFPVDATSFTTYISGGLMTRTGPTLPVENPAPPPPHGIPYPFNN